MRTDGRRQTNSTPAFQVKRDLENYHDGHESLTYYVEIKCQLDATDEFLLQILLLAQHVSGTIMPIIRSSRVLYKLVAACRIWCLVFKLSVWCGAEGCVFGLRAVAQQPLV